MPYRQRPAQDREEVQLRVDEAGVHAVLGYAASAAASLVWVGGLEVLSVAGASAAVALAHAVERRARCRALQRMCAFLGTDRVLVGGGAFTRPDGVRRVRFSKDDLDLRYERLDVRDGRTLASYRVREWGALGTRLESRAKARLPEGRAASSFAWVHGRCVNRVCFSGLPPSLGGGPRAREIRLVRIVPAAEGVLARRIDPGGRPAGDTRHETLDAAVEQLRWELGRHLGTVHRGEAPARPRPVRPWET